MAGLTRLAQIENVGVNLKNFVIVLIMLSSNVLILIRSALQRIRNFAQEGEGIFLESLIIQDAIIRNFEVIGEATK